MAVDNIARMMALDAAQQGGTSDAYTKAETDALLGGKADLENGTIPLNQIPPAAIERMITVQDDTARFALTTDDVQLGDTVKVVSTNKMYLVIDTDHLDSAAGYSVYVAGRAAEAVADEDGNNIKSTYAKIANIATVATSGSYSDLTNKPTIPTVDQTYSASSTNAQSGVAIEGKKPGLKTTGTEYTISGSTVVAGTGAEAFNDYTSNKASGSYSHAEGYNTTASNDGSHAEGQYTNASGSYSHAEGYGTTASGRRSHAEGAYTKAASQCQHVQGKYNVEDSSDTYAFIIGNGTADNARHNAFAIDWNGLIYVNGASTGVDVSQLTPVTVDQTYNAQSANAQSGTAVASAISGKISATDYATQTTGGTIKAWTTTDGSDTILHLATQ